MKLNKKLLGFAAISLPFAFAPIALSASCNKEAKLEVKIAEEKNNTQLEQGSTWTITDTMKLDITKVKFTVISKDIVKNLGYSESKDKTKKYYQFSTSRDDQILHGIKEGSGKTYSSYDGTELFKMELGDPEYRLSLGYETQYQKLTFKSKSGNEHANGSIQCDVNGNTITFKFRIANEKTKQISSQIYVGTITLK